ncbi:MAG: carbamoyltransferase C-terminal domain-containing protein, partial [Planctomycetota bacterium]
EEGLPQVQRLYTDRFLEEFGPARRKEEPLRDEHWDLAASAQRLTEEVIFHMAEDLHRRTQCPNLCITGGVAQNSVANGKIIENTSFENLYVPPAGHDAGTSVGSSLYFYHHKLGRQRLPFQHNAYTGVQYSNEEVEQILKSRQVAFKRLEDDQLFQVVSDCLARGGVVGWFQGRAEFGPRALGNRSILADPRRADAKDILNEKIKRRESFRPFAPSILKECVHEYFEQVDDVPYMEKVFRIRPEKQPVIPAVTHVDGTGRLQTVDRSVAPRYHALISNFNRVAGVPVLLNTSFNENEPIVNSPEHALACFDRTKMDMLVMQNVLIHRG